MIKSYRRFRKSHLTRMILFLMKMHRTIARNERSKKTKLEICGHS
jgi:hypothetical protein